MIVHLGRERRGGRGREREAKRRKVEKRSTMGVRPRDGGAIGLPMYEDVAKVISDI